MTKSIEDLSPKERILFDLLLKERQSRSTPPSQEIQPRETSDPPPLSFAQQRLWFLNQLRPNDPSYNIVFCRRLKGKLDVEALERSLNEIVRRHESLRTFFLLIDGHPAQV